MSGIMDMPKLVPCTVAVGKHNREKVPRLALEIM